MPAARRYVRGVLAGTPRAGDVELIACELIANSIRHTPSGGMGDKFTVSISAGNGWSRVEVTDAGTGQWHPPDLGHDVTPEGQTLWAEIHWAETGKAVAP